MTLDARFVQRGVSVLVRRVRVEALVRERACEAEVTLLGDPLEPLLAPIPFVASSSKKIPNC